MFIIVAFNYGFHKSDSQLFRGVFISRALLRFLCFRDFSSFPTNYIFILQEYLPRTPSSLSHSKPSAWHHQDTNTTIKILTIKVGPHKNKPDCPTMSRATSSSKSSKAAR
jgi:hypothetical protein